MKAHLKPAEQEDWRAYHETTRQAMTTKCSSCNLNEVLLSLPLCLQSPGSTPCPCTATYLNPECRFIRINDSHDTTYDPPSSRSFTVSSVIPSKYKTKNQPRECMINESLQISSHTTANIIKSKQN